MAEEQAPYVVSVRRAQKEAPQPEAPVIINYDIDDVQALLDRRIKFQSEAWGFASAYDAAVTIAGYGALFTLWGAVASDITPKARTLVAALLGVSVLLYVAWTLLSMLARHRFDRELIASIVKPQPPEDAILEWDQVELKKRRGVLAFQMRWWPFIFGAAVATGLGGGLVLIYSSLAAALGLPLLDW